MKIILLIDATSQMLKSVASECHKRGQTVLHFVNATPKVAKSISCTLPSADIAFLPKVMLSCFNASWKENHTSSDCNHCHSVKGG